MTKRLSNASSNPSFFQRVKPLLPQLYVFLVQLGFFLINDWLYVRHDYALPLSDTEFWWVVIPITWAVYSLIFYYYSRKPISAILQGAIQTVASWIVAAVLGLVFHSWIGGSF